jgi:hypothetical protein
MDFDWNWFFSSFSQSAAALIGIIGAFIISRLLGLGEKINNLISQFDNLIIEFNRISASLSNRRFYWYTKTNIKYDSGLKEAIRNGDFEGLNDNEIVSKICDDDKTLFRIDAAVLEGFNEIYEKHKPRKTEKNSVGVFSMLNTPGVLDSITPASLWDNLRNEKEEINKLEVEARTLIQYFRQNLHDLNSLEDSIKPLRIIIIILMISFPLTVVYPLHFMPIRISQNPILTFNVIVIIKSFFTLKSFMLNIFFVTIEGIFYYFLTLTNQLTNRLNRAVTDNSDDYRDIKNYCEYFEND